MKIIATKRDDILRDKAAYEAGKVERQSKFDEQYSVFREALNNVTTNIATAVNSELRSHANEVNIDVDFGFKNNVEVKVNNGHSPFGPHALSWNWSVTLDKNGDVIKDSGSWSGLSAVTAEQIQDLRNTVDILDMLNNIDWKTLLNTKVPDYKDYITMNNPKYEKPDRDYDTELKEADIQDMIGDEDSAVFVGNALPDYFRGNAYATILKETPKRFNVRVFHQSQLDKWKNGENVVEYEATVSKDKFYKCVDTSKIVKR